MRVRPRIPMIGLFLFGLAPSAFAQGIVVPLPNVTVTGGTPVTVTSGSVPVMTNILGFSLQGNWTAINPPPPPNDPWPSDLVVGITPSGVPASQIGSIGGPDNGNPYAFGFGYNSPRAINNLTGSLPTSTSGTLSATFDTFLTGTTVSLTNASVTVFTNPNIATGTTTGGPTFNRPIVDSSGLSGTGTAVRYSTHTVTVSLTGTYMFALSASTPGYDGFLLMYQNSFNPALGLTNLMVAGDGDLEADPDAFVVQLNAGQTYILVATGFLNTNSGDYRAFGAGPGTVTFTPVPEPIGMLGLAAVGFLGTGAVRRFRKATRG